MTLEHNLGLVHNKANNNSNPWVGSIKDKCLNSSNNNLKVLMVFNLSSNKILWLDLICKYKNNNNRCSHKDLNQLLAHNPFQISKCRMGSIHNLSCRCSNKCLKTNLGNILHSNNQIVLPNLKDLVIQLSSKVNNNNNQFLHSNYKVKVLYSNHNNSNNSNLKSNKWLQVCHNNK